MTSYPSPLSVLAEELEELRAKGLFRKIRTLSDWRGRCARWEEKELLLFCGNDYLGLSQNPFVIQAASRALQEYGVGVGAARLISGTTPFHTQLEAKIARFKKKENALIFGAGYLANLGVLGALAREEDLIVMDKLCHASLIDGARLSGATLRIFPHKHYGKARAILERNLRFRRRILVSDSVFSMDGDLADLEEIVHLRENYNLILVVDDAHGTGVFGAEGRGATEGFEEKIDVITGTFSKAFGVFGGFVAASETLIQQIVNTARTFIFATAAPPALMAAVLESLRLVSEIPALREKLWENVERVQKFLMQKNLQTHSNSPIFPILIGDEKKAVQISESLLEKGILIPAVRYPSVAKGKARLRLTVSASHTEGDFEKLFHVLGEVLS